MIPFQQMGKGVTFTGATSAPSAVQCLTDNNVISQQYVIVNTGSVNVFFGWGQNANEAGARAVIPTGTPAYGYCVLAGTKETITGPKNAFFTGITGSSTAVCYVYPGTGE